jgi:hypothetical protein
LIEHGTYKEESQVLTVSITDILQVFISFLHNIKKLNGLNKKARIHSNMDMIDGPLLDEG